MLELVRFLFWKISSIIPNNREKFIKKIVAVVLLLNRTKKIKESTLKPNS